MNANVQFFSNPQFGNIRTLELNNKMWFGATDVATSLGYSNPRDAIVRHCKSNGVVIHDVIDSMGRNQQMKFINEGNVYRLVASSQLPTADEFESWIFDEVIPSVIHTGGYIATKEDDTADEIMARALIVANATLAKREERIKNLQEENARQGETINLLTNEVKQSAPKIKCYNEYISSEGTYTTTQIAKEYGWGAETLNKKLAAMGVQYKQNGQWILYAKYDNKGYTVSKPVTFPKNDGTTGTQMQTRWTSKGREFIHSLFAN
jgi:toxin-antitoxin system, toxin component, bro family